MGYYQKHIFVCANQKAPGKICCQNTGGKLFGDYLREKLKSLDLHGPGKFRVSTTGCLGRCADGPVLVIYPDNVWYTYHSEADLDAIIEQHLLHQQIVTALLLP